MVNTIHQSKSLLAILLFVVSFFSASAQKEVKALVVDYKIEIESGRDPKRPEVRPKSIVAFNRLYIYGHKAVYVALDSTKKWSDYTAEQKSFMWSKGKTSYRYEKKDSNCCVLYSELKKRYRTESTVIQENILGRHAKKVIVYDDVNQLTYLVWDAPTLAVPVSPLGFMPVSGLVMRLRNENVVYEAVKISYQNIPESFFETKEGSYQFSEKAFRAGVVR